MKWKFHLPAESSVKWRKTKCECCFQRCKFAYTHYKQWSNSCVLYTTPSLHSAFVRWGCPPSPPTPQDWVKFGTLKVLMSFAIFALRALIRDCVHDSNICLSGILCTLFLSFSSFFILKVQIRLCCCSITLSHAEFFIPFDFKYFPESLCLSQCFLNMLRNLYIHGLESFSKLSKHLNCNSVQFPLHRAELKHRCKTKAMLFKMEPFLIVMYMS